MSEYRELTKFEKICKIFGRVKLPIPKFLEKKLMEEIEFCHFKVSPQEIFSTSILIPSILMLLSYILLALVNLATIDVVFSFFMIAAILFYFIINYTKFQTIYYLSLIHI